MGAPVNLVTYPLTSAQTEIWLGQQMHPDSPVYNIAQFTVIHGAIDATLFYAALGQVINEASSLRLHFVESDDGFRQYLGLPNGSILIADMSAEADPQAAVEAWMRTDYELPADLLNDPLFSYALLKVAPDRFIWYQRCHHIVMDALSLFLVAQRVAHVYSALQQGLAPNPKPCGSVLKLFKSDTQYRTSEQWTQDEIYWLKHCTDWPEPVTLTNRLRSALRHRLRKTTYLCSQAISTYVADGRRLAQLFIATLAAYLYRLTGLQDIVFSFPVKARFGADRHIPGMKSNALPFRLTVQPDMNLSLLMAQAAQEMQCGLPHQRYPSEVLRRQLGLMRGQSLMGPVINLMPFDYNLSFGEHASTTHNLVNGPVADLMIVITILSGDSQLRIDFDANPAGYTTDELMTFQRRFIKLLETLIADPTQPISRIDLLDDEERHRLLAEWNTTQCDYPAHLCIHQLFEAQVERTPDATALVCEGQSLSYAELNGRANHLAYQLMTLGVQPDARVAICAERGFAMIIGLLAVLKTGGAYVPLDPVYPAARLATILADAAPPIVLVDTAGRAALGERALRSRAVLDLQAALKSVSTNPQVPGLSSDLHFGFYRCPQGGHD